MNSYILKPDDYFRGTIYCTDYERGLSEKEIEKKSVKWARSVGWFSRKYSSPGQKGVQDRIFVKGGRVVFVEYKKVGNVPTDLQCDDAQVLKEHGGEVWWTNTLTGTKIILRGKT